MFKGLDTLFRGLLIAIALLIVLVLILLPRACKAQGVPVNDCCTQAIDFKHRYEATRLVLDSTRNTGDRLLAAADARIRQLTLAGNSRLVTEQKRGDRLATQNEALQARLDETTSQNEVLRQANGRLQQDLDKARPRTLLAKAWRGLGVGLKWVGITTVVVGGTLAAIAR